MLEVHSRCWKGIWRFSGGKVSSNYSSITLFCIMLFVDYCLLILLCLWYCICLVGTFYIEGTHNVLVVLMFWEDVFILQRDYRSTLSFLNYFFCNFNNMLTLLIQKGIWLYQNKISLWLHVVPNNISKKGSS